MSRFHFNALRSGSKITTAPAVHYMTPEARERIVKEQNALNAARKSPHTTSKIVSTFPRAQR